MRSSLVRTLGKILRKSMTKVQPLKDKRNPDKYNNDKRDTKKTLILFGLKIQPRVSKA